MGYIKLQPRVRPIQSKKKQLLNGKFEILQHQLVMLVFMQPNESQMGVINDEKSNLEVHLRDGCRIYKEATYLEITTRTQKMKMSHGNSVTALYATSNNLSMRFETQTDAGDHFAISRINIQAYLNNRKTNRKNGYYFILIYK
jgi:hypothetical protein